MIDEKKWKQFGKEGLIPIAITIHNTNNYQMSASELFDYTDKNYKTMNSAGYHYIVDYKDIIEFMPINYKVYHTGKAEDWAFNNSIAIEICSNLNNELYLKGQDNAIKLIKELMKKYNLTKNDIYFHQDFNVNTYCPATILNLYGNKRNFLEKFFK